MPHEEHVSNSQAVSQWTSYHQRILEKGYPCRITAITRPTSTYTPPEGSGMKHKTIDYYSLQSLTEVFSAQDAVVNCIARGVSILFLA